MKHVFQARKDGWPLLKMKLFLCFQICQAQVVKASMKKGLRTPPSLPTAYERNPSQGSTEHQAIIAIDSSIILNLSLTGPRHDLQSGCFVTNAWYQQSCFVISYVREIKSMQVCTAFSAVKLSVICHNR